MLDDLVFEDKSGAERRQCKKAHLGEIMRMERSGRMRGFSIIMARKRRPHEMLRKGFRSVQQ